MGFIKDFFTKPRPRPEGNYRITITDVLVKVEHPKYKTETVFWDKLNTISLVNTDHGPWAPDIWLKLKGETDSCMIPHGSEGFERVYEVVSKNEDFNFNNFIKSMSVTSNMEFLLWKRKPVNES